MLTKTKGRLGANQTANGAERTPCSAVQYTTTTTDNQAPVFGYGYTVAELEEYRARVLRAMFADAADVLKMNHRALAVRLWNEQARARVKREQDALRQACEERRS